MLMTDSDSAISDMENTTQPKKSQHSVSATNMSKLSPPTDPHHQHQCVWNAPVFDPLQGSINTFRLIKMLVGQVSVTGLNRLARKPFFEITWTLMKWFFVRFYHVDNLCRLSGRHNLESETVTQKLWISSCIIVVINSTYSKRFRETKDENDFISIILCRELEIIKCCTWW